MIELSIIIPVYKVEKYIGHCIESVIAQETSGISMECIVIDDCGPDRSMDIVRSMVDAYHGTIDFRIIRHEHNRGVAAGRNTGFEAARGEFVMLIDSDDYLQEGCVANLMKASREHPSADLIVGNFYSAEQKELCWKNLKDTMVLDSQKDIRRKFLTVELNCFPWNRLLRRQFVLDHKLFFQEGTIFEDVIWGYHLFHEVREVVLIPESTYVYEYNPASVMHSTREKSIATIRSFVSFCNEMLDQPYDDDLYVAHRLYVFNIMMKAIDTRMQASVTPEVSRSLDALRSRLWNDALHHRQVLLVLFFSTAYPPFNLLLRTSLFRRHFDGICHFILRQSGT